LAVQLAILTGITSMQTNRCYLIPSNGRTLRREATVVPEINFSLQHPILSQRGM